MSKRLIVAMALSLVLVSGSLFSAHADCGLCGLNLNLCGWHLASCFSCAARDVDKRPVDIANNAVSMESDYPVYYRGK